MPKEAHIMAITSAIRRSHVVGVFDDHYKADEAVTELIAAGFTAKEVGTIVRDPHVPLGEDEKADAYGEASIERTATGAVTGAILGGALGAVSSILIPGFGPVLLTGMLVMAAAGGFAGGFAGLVSSMQLSDEEKHYYHQEVLRGKTLVTVNAGDRFNEAAAILERCGARDVTRAQRD
jgi:hypothetical protein